MFCNILLQGRLNVSITSSSLEQSKNCLPIRTVISLALTCKHLNALTGTWADELDVWSLGYTLETYSIKAFASFHIRLAGSSEPM